MIHKNSPWKCLSMTEFHHNPSECHFHHNPSECHRWDVLLGSLKSTKKNVNIVNQPEFLSSFSFSWSSKRAKTAQTNMVAYLVLAIRTNSRYDPTCFMWDCHANYRTPRQFQLLYLSIFPKVFCEERTISPMLSASPFNLNGDNRGWITYPSRVLHVVPKGVT